MLSNSQSKAINKLRMDVRRSLHDHAINGQFSLLKLAVVVDFWPVIYFRLLEFCLEKKSIVRKIYRILLVLLKPLVEGMSGARIYVDAVIGGGLLLHQSTGVVIAPGTVIGNNCTFFSGACVVYKANDVGFAAPIIGNNVRLMAGCKVIGNVRIGDNASIGANAVVTKDVPPDSIAVGVPAHIIQGRSQEI